MWQAVEVSTGEYAVVETTPGGLPIVATGGTPDAVTWPRDEAERIAAERNAED